jgi:hypothetical protein
MKIFDIVFFYNEHELLHRRIEYLKKRVNRTIVLNFGGDHIEDDRVTVIPVMEHFNDFKKKEFVKMIVNFIGKKNISYKDKFIFSKTFEIPSIEILDKFILDKSEGPTILSQETYIHSVRKKSIYKHFGCALSSYGDLFNKTNIEYFLFENDDVVYNQEKFLNGGYCLINFEKTEKSLKSLKYWFEEYTKNLTLESLEDLKSYNKNIFNGEKDHSLTDVINKDLKIFDNINDHQPKTKQIYISFLYEKNIPNIYDEIVYITENNEEMDGLKTWFVKKPQKIYYKSKEYFEDYKKNDILMYLRSLNLNENDEIYIKTKTVSDPTVFKYKDLKNSIPSEII